MLDSENEVKLNVSLAKSWNYSSYSMKSFKTC